MKYPAIGMIETNSIARGIVVHDVMLKKAQIDVVQSNSICPGKYVVFIAGLTADVEEAMEDGLHYGGQAVIDHLIIPNVSETIFPAIIGGNQDLEIEAVGIVETFSVASAVVLADMAVKRTNVRLLDLRLAQGLGGKAYFIITGAIHAVEDSAEHVREAAEPGMLTNIELLPAPHDGLKNSIGGRIL